MSYLCLAWPYMDMLCVAGVEGRLSVRHQRDWNIFFGKGKHQLLRLEDECLMFSFDRQRFFLYASINF